MLGITHALIGLALAKALGLIELNSYLKIFVVMFFAMLPDIDIPSSLLGKIFFPISRFLYARFGHRNITHSLIFMLFLTSPFAINLDIYFLIVLAYGSHLIGDMLTYTGVPLFWPQKKNYNLFGGPLITGKWTEGIICVLSLAVFFLL